MSDPSTLRFTTNDELRKLIKEITKVPDGQIDRWLIIEEIKNIIKSSYKSISNRDIIAARIGYVASLPKQEQTTSIENIKDHALSLGFNGEEFEEFLLFLLAEILKAESQLLESLKKEKLNEKK